MQNIIKALGRLRKKVFRSYPTILAIDHGRIGELLKNPGITEVLLEIGKHVKSGSTIFLEVTKEEPERDVKDNSRQSWGYGPIIDYAQKNGIRIVPLDSERIAKIIDNAAGLRYKWKQIETAARESGFTAVPSLDLYAALNLRERSWNKILESAKPDDVVIMHPTHAWRIAGEFGGRKRVRWLHPVDQHEIRYIENITSKQELKKLANFRSKLRQKRREAKI